MNENIVAFGKACAKAVGGRVVRGADEGYAEYGARVCGLVKVRVLNYPCCLDRAWGSVTPDGMVMLDDGDGYPWTLLAGKHRIEIHVV